MRNSLVTHAQHISREILVTMISLAVMVYTVSYIAGQDPAQALAFELESTDTAVSPTQIVFYGVVVDRTTGKPVRGATVTIARSVSGGTFDQVSTATTRADGTFNCTINNAPSGQYKLIVEANLTSGTIRDGFIINATAGHAYGVRAELIQKEYFLLLPLPGY